jgi:hypothetical protein
VNFILSREREEQSGLLTKGEKVLWVFLISLLTVHAFPLGSHDDERPALGHAPVCKLNLIFPTGGKAGRENSAEAHRLETKD